MWRRVTQPDFTRKGLKKKKKEKEREKKRQKQSYDDFRQMMTIIILTIPC